MNSLFVAGICLIAAFPAVAANPLALKDPRQNIDYTVGDTVRVVDAPIVRSSKGCIAFLREDKNGRVRLTPLRDKNRRQICHKDWSYDAEAESAK